MEFFPSKAECSKLHPEAQGLSLDQDSGIFTGALVRDERRVERTRDLTPASLKEDRTLIAGESEGQQRSFGESCLELLLGHAPRYVLQESYLGEITVKFSENLKERLLREFTYLLNSDTAILLEILYEIIEVASTVTVQNAAALCPSLSIYSGFLTLKV